jgi:nitronate monooxygenase
VLDRLARHEPVTYPLYVSGAAPGDDTTLTFTPRDFMDGDLPALTRPKFLAIIASNVLALTLLKKANGTVDGFVVEGPTAGGHNAPPRGKLQLSETGEAVYGERDVVDLEKMRALGTPFWLAGGYGSAEHLQSALAAGAAGIQVGTAFAFCEESGLRDDYKRALLDKAIRGEARVFTDPLASPASFPFKVAQLEGTVSDRSVYAARARVCDLGYLREAFRQPDGSVGFRCAAEPVAAYLAKGGAIDDTVGRKCVCNGLLANIAQAQVRGRTEEQGLITAGDDLGQIGRFLPPNATTYAAADVVSQLTRVP